MTPTSFTFSLTVPRDARFAPIVRDLATQAATYSEMDATVAGAFVARVGEASARATARPGGGSLGVRFTCGDGELAVDLDGDIVRQPLASA